MPNADLENKLLAVIRVRGRVGVRRDITETMQRLNLRRVNNMVLVPGTKSNIGMIQKCNDFVTYGEIDSAYASKLLEKKGVKANAADLDAVASGKKKIAEVAHMPIRLHPPRHGYEGLKVSFSRKGALGYRGTKINGLITRMA